MVFTKAMLEAVLSVAGGAADTDGVEGVDIGLALRMGALRGSKQAGFSTPRNTRRRR